MKPIVKSFLYLFFKKGAVRCQRITIPHLTVLLFIMLLVLSCSKKEANQTRNEPDHRSGFQQVGFYQKGDNRIYTIYTSDEDWTAMEEYADRKPYKTGKTTSVFFFNNREGTPNVTKYQGLWSDVIDRIYADGDTANWIARYDRFPSGDAIFKRYPANE